MGFMVRDIDFFCVDLELEQAKDQQFWDMLHSFIICGGYQIKLRESIGSDAVVTITPFYNTDWMTFVLKVQDVVVSRIRVFREYAQVSQFTIFSNKSNVFYDILISINITLKQHSEMYIS